MKASIIYIIIRLYERNYTVIGLSLCVCVCVLINKFILFLYNPWIVLSSKFFVPFINFQLRIKLFLKYLINLSLVGRLDESNSLCNLSIEFVKKLIIF